MRFYLPGGMLRRADADLSDLTASTPAGAPYWAPGEPDVLVYPMDPQPTPAEQTAIRRRLVTADAADEANLYDLLAAVEDPATPSWARLTLRGELARYGE